MKMVLALGGSKAVQALLISSIISKPALGRIHTLFGWCCHIDNFTKLFNIDSMDITISNKVGDSRLHIITRRKISDSSMKSYNGQ